MLTKPNLRLAKILAAIVLVHVPCCAYLTSAMVPLPEGVPITSGLPEAAFKVYPLLLITIGLFINILIAWSRKSNLGKMCFTVIPEHTIGPLPDGFNPTDKAAIEDGLKELRSATDAYDSSTVGELYLVGVLSFLGIFAAGTAQHLLIGAPFFITAGAWLGLLWPHQNGVFKLLSPQARATLMHRHE